MVVIIANYDPMRSPSDAPLRRKLSLGAMLGAFSITPETHRPSWSHPGTFLPDRLRQRGRWPSRFTQGAGNKISKIELVDLSAEDAKRAEKI